MTGGQFQELHGDRSVKDDKAMVGGFGLLDGKTVMFIGQQKGINTKMRQYRNFGMPNPEGYRKALRLMKLAEKFNKPIVTFIDTPGAFPGLEAEERGQGEAIARNIYEMMRLKVPVICVIIGEGASGGALGIGVGDRVVMLENTWYSVISPESCSSILWRSWDFKERAADALKLTSTAARFRVSRASTTAPRSRPRPVLIRLIPRSPSPLMRVRELSRYGKASAPASTSPAGLYGAVISAPKPGSLTEVC
jgi:acetyl-CoA carboxylase carboxyl transferase subunit alpha